MTRSSSPLEAPLVREDPKPLVKKCIAVLARRLQRAGRIGFKEVLYARGEREFLLLSPQGSSAQARQDYPVLYFEETPSKTYWLAISFRFSPWLERFRLVQASLLVFEGPLTDPEKTALFRAEWDELEDNGIHAQPHWHVYPAGTGALPRPSAGGFPSGRSEPAEFVPQASFPTAPAEAERVDRLRFHFAMAAQWHLEDGGSCRSRFSESGLTSWLVGCIEYIRGQLPHFSREKLVS